MKIQFPPLELYILCLRLIEKKTISLYVESIVDSIYIYIRLRFVTSSVRFNLLQTDRKYTEETMYFSFSL